MILKFCYHKLIGKNGIEMEFDYYVVTTDLIRTKDKETEVIEWCVDNCEHEYKIRANGIWFQTREDAVAFKLRWL